MSRRINVLGKPIEYDVGVSYDSTTKIGIPKILEPGTDDLSNETLEAIVANTSDVSRGSGDPEKRNRYPLGSGLKKVDINDANGNPVSLDSSPNTSARTNGTGKQFIESQEETTQLKNYSNSTAKSSRNLKNPGNVDSFLKKGKNVLNEGEFDGNTLLREGTPKIQESYVSPILSNNRFTATSERGRVLPSTENGRPVSQDDRSVRINANHPESTLGSYRAYREDNNGRDVVNGHFANIGTLLTIRATAELGSSTGYGSDGPDGIGASAVSLLPGTAQIGLIKVDVEDLTAMEAFKSLLEDNTDPVNLDPNAANDHLINDTGSKSFGQMNNVLEPFSGLLPLGMLAASTALVLAMKLALKGLTILLAKITSAKAGTVKKDSQGRYILGSYIHAAAVGKKFPPLPIPAKLLGLADTSHDFEDCVDAGIDVVFGSSVGNSFERLLESPGYYAVLCRSIVRSAAGIVIQVQNAVKGNPVQVAQNIIELVNVIKSSKVISAINVLVGVGDAVLTQADRPFQKEEILGMDKYSTVDALDDSVRVGKGRRQGTLQNSLATSTSPSSFLFPRETVAALTAYSQRFGGGISPAAIASIKSRNGVSSKLGDTGSKISEEIYKSVEAELDAEYVPFYFHDLRTNEIVSFHAFLKSMSDDYTVDSESSKTLGRIDPVKIYKSTERKISLEFWIVSTSKEDFDQMWWKINKLTTLIYPQWSKGASMNIPGTQDSFIQPFSQVPTNSPLIRIRLGDLFRSNYSKFALARLFGLGQSDSFYNTQIEDSALVKISAFSQLMQDSNFESLKDLNVEITAGVYPVDSGGTFPTISIGKAQTESSVSLRDGGIAKITKRKDDGTYVVKLVDTTINSNSFVVPGGQISVKKSELAKSLNSFFESSDGTAVDKNVLDNIQKFLSKDSSSGNTIVRSFESSAGKGLACMIDSMGFNWLDGIPWETDVFGSRAPKMCQVKISITPIHDIAPGLDVNGFNRAPIYNVGEIMNGISGDSYDESGAGEAKFNAVRKKLRDVLK